MIYGMSIGEWIAELREKGLENAIDRFYSVYAAKVEDDADPEQRGRVRVLLKSLGFTRASPKYADPISPYAGDNYGFYFPPHKGDAAWVSFDHGDNDSARIIGGWWCNKGSNRKPETSSVPAEFVKANGGSPTARGIKTKGGHGLIFEDDSATKHVELWSGTNNPVGQEADKNHSVRLDDFNQQIKIETTNGHATTMSDKSGEIFVETITSGGHGLKFDDTNKLITLATTNGHSIALNDNANSNNIKLETVNGFTMQLDDTNSNVTITTPQGHAVTISDSDREIRVKTTGNRTILLSDRDSVTRIVTPGGQIIEQSDSGTVVTDPTSSGLTVNATSGPVNVNSVDSNNVSSGNSTRQVAGDTTDTFAGPKSDTYTSGYSATVSGTWAIISAALVTVGAALVQLGNGPAFRLIDERFLAVYNAHTHISANPGVPTLGPSVLGITGVHTTIQTSAA